MKQTAVEWLQEQLECFGNKHELQMSWATVDELLKQAKEMEKEQMALCYKVGVIDGNNGEILNFDNYYKETFKSE
jgi:hypothetical protein